MANLDIPQSTIPARLSSGDLKAATFKEVANQDAFLQSGTGAVIRSINSRLSEIISIFDFMTATEQADYTARTINNEYHTNIQLALNAAESNGASVFLPPGTAGIGAKTEIGSDTKLIGVGSASVLQATSSLPVGQQILVNKNISAVLDTYDDSNIKIFQLKFDGGGNTGRTAALVDMAQVKGYEVAGCEFTNCDHIGFGDGGSDGGRFYSNRLHALGNIAGASPALWVQSNPSTLTPTRRFNGYANFFHDNLRSGALFAGQESSLSFNEFKNNGESTIFISDKGSNLRVNYNDIDGTTFHTSAAHGIENGADDVEIIGNRITNTDGPSIGMQDCARGIISHNILSAYSLNTTAFPTNWSRSGVGIGTTSGGRCDDMTITHNTFTKGATGGDFCIVSSVATGAFAPKGLLIKDNNTRGGFVTAPVRLQSATGSCIDVNSLIEGGTDGQINSNGETNGRELTIATGVISVYALFHLVDTESNAATDDLDTINGGIEGRIYIFKAASDTRDIVFKDGTGNLALNSDFTLTHSADSISLLYDGTNWLEASRSDNTA